MFPSIGGHCIVVATGMSLEWNVIILYLLSHLFGPLHKFPKDDLLLCGEMYAYFLWWFHTMICISKTNVLLELQRLFSHKKGTNHIVALGWTTLLSRAKLNVWRSPILDIESIWLNNWESIWIWTVDAHLAMCFATSSSQWVDHSTERCLSKTMTIPKRPLSGRSISTLSPIWWLDFTQLWALLELVLCDSFKLFIN